MKASTTTGSKSVPVPLSRIFFRVERRHRLAVWAIAGQRVVDVGHRDDPRLERDILAAQRVVAGAVELVVVREDDRQDAPQRAADRFEQFHASVDVALHLLEFVLRQARGLVEQLRLISSLPMSCSSAAARTSSIRSAQVSGAAILAAYTETRYEWFSVYWSFEMKWRSSISTPS